MKLPRTVTIVEVRQNGYTACVIQSNDLVGKDEWRAFAADLEEFLFQRLIEIRSDVREHSARIGVTRGRAYNILTDAMTAHRIRVTRS